MANFGALIPPYLTFTASPTSASASNRPLSYTRWWPLPLMPPHDLMLLRLVGASRVAWQFLAGDGCPRLTVRCTKSHGSTTMVAGRQRGRVVLPCPSCCNQHPPGAAAAGDLPDMLLTITSPTCCSWWGPSPLS
jgi:hypothetical protein